MSVQVLINNSEQRRVEQLVLNAQSSMPKVKKIKKDPKTYAGRGAKIGGAIGGANTALGLPHNLGKSGPLRGMSRRGKLGAAALALGGGVALGGAVGGGIGAMFKRKKKT